MSTSDSEKAVRLRALCGVLKKEFAGAAFVPVQLIGGKRWAALERLPSAVAEEFPLDAPHLIESSPGWGVMIYGWSSLDASQQDRIAARCNMRAERGE